MSTIGLYDIDLLHSPSSWPNLELMKVYNYFHEQGDQVLLMNRKEDEGRYNKIIYFKDNKNLNIPHGVNVIGKNKSIYGQGFFNTFTELPDKYLATPPDPMVYLTCCEKFKRLKWNNFSTSSIVRFQNKDFTGLKAGAKDMYIVDRDFCQMDGATDFLLKYKQNKFHFFHSLKMNSEEDFHKFERFTLILNKPVYIDFIFHKDFVAETLNEKFHFNVYYKQDGESEESFFIRIIKFIIFMKNQGKIVMCNIPNVKNAFLKEIDKWGITPAQCSYAEYYKDNKQALSYMNKASTEIRLLLKTNPKNINTQMFDF